MGRRGYYEAIRASKAIKMLLGPTRLLRGYYKAIRAGEALMTGVLSGPGN